MDHPLEISSTLSTCLNRLRWTIRRLLIIWKSKSLWKCHTMLMPSKFYMNIRKYCIFYRIKWCYFICTIPAHWIEWSWNGAGCPFHRLKNAKHSILKNVSESNDVILLRLFQEKYKLASDRSKVIGWAVKLICWTDALESALRPNNEYQWSMVVMLKNNSVLL